MIKIKLKAGRYYTVEELAKEKGLCMQTVRNHIRWGWVSAVRIPLTKNKSVFLVHEKDIKGVSNA